MKVKFILIGGHAAIYYGVNRNTGNLDILIEATQGNGQQLLYALKNMGLELPDIELPEVKVNWCCHLESSQTQLTF